MKPSPLLRLLALTVLLPLCACSAGTPSSSASASSASASSASASSASASSETPVSSASDVLDAETGYLNIDKVVAFLGMSITDDVSACFREDAAGYIVNDGPYLVDADTLVRLTDAKVTGTGSVKWTGFRELDRSAGHPDPFSGVIPVSKLSDPVFCAMNLPSEITTYMSYRVNGANMYPADSQYKKLVTIGAIYKEKNTVPTLPGFRLVESRPIRFSFTLEGEQIRNLFAMTPHLFRISRAGAQRLSETTRLRDTASCVLNIYRAI